MRGAAQPPKLLIIDGRTNELPPLEEMTPNTQGEGVVSPVALRTRVKGKLREGRATNPGDGEGGSNAFQRSHDISWTAVFHNNHSYHRQ
jgi:hypothetical protein